MAANESSNFVKIIKEICAEKEIILESYSYDWAFRLTKNGVSNYIFGYQFGLNKATMQSICGDKSAASEIMTAHHIPNIAHYCFMSPRKLQYVAADGNQTRLLKLLEQYKKLVCKDNEGTGGESVYLVHSKKELEYAVYTIFQTAHSMSVSPYYEIEEEYRLIILNGQLKLIYQKERPHLVGDGVRTIRELYADYMKQKEKYNKIDTAISSNWNKVLDKGKRYYLNWKHNLGQGARAVLVEKEELIQSLWALAKRAVDLLQIQFASIDIVLVEGNYFILEINSGVMMEHLAGQGEEYYKKVREIYTEAIEFML